MESVGEGVTSVQAGDHVMPCYQAYWCAGLAPVCLPVICDMVFCCGREEAQGRALLGAAGRLPWGLLLCGPLFHKLLILQ